MLLTTIAVVLVASVAIELTALRTIPTKWPWMRWSVMPAAGALIAGALPLGLLPQAYWIDFWVGEFIGVAIASTVAMGAIFTYDFWSGPSEAELARTGRRSALQGIGLAAKERAAAGPRPQVAPRETPAPRAAYRTVRPNVPQAAVPKKRTVSPRLDLPRAFDDDPERTVEKEAPRYRLRRAP